MDGWNTSFVLGWPIFTGELLVSGRVNLDIKISIFFVKILGNTQAAGWLTEKKSSNQGLVGFHGLKETVS